MERNRLRARNRMISGLARDFVHRCIQFDIHQYLASSSSWYFVSLTRWAKPQTCKPHSLEARKTTIDSYLNYTRRYFRTRLRLHTRRSASLSVHTCYFSKETSLARKYSLVFDTTKIYSSYDRLFSFSWLRNCKRSKDKGRISRSSYAWLFHVLIFIRGDLQSGIRKGGRRENPLTRIYSTLVG